jgi:methyl-accepting chemotaxis protein
MSNPLCRFSNREKSLQMNLANLKISVRLVIGFGLILFFLLVLTVLALAAGREGTTQVLIAGSGAAMLLGGFVIAWWVTRGIVRPLQEAIEVSMRMAKGDIGEAFEARGQGELLELQQALQEMAERMFQIVGRVRSGTAAVATSTAFIRSDNEALAGRTESQAASLEETASAMDQLTSTVKQTAENAILANRLVASASESAVKGGMVVDHVVETMAAIKDSSRKIVDIISVIDGIAFQTNILALNAAVEAARAGEQGRGFAVVAGEVRSLAQRSSSAAKEIKSLIGDSVDKVDAGSNLVDEAGAAMSEIVASVKRVASIMSEIASASSEQSAGIEEVNRAVMQMDGMTQKNAALVDDASRTAVGLQEQAETLSNAVSIFSLGAREFGNADEAIAMVKRGAEFVRTYGKATGIQEISNSQGLFIDRDLYLGMCDVTGKIIANGGNQRVIGAEGNKIKDVEDKYFVNEIMKVARHSGSGWVDYKWVHPISKEIMTKTAYVEAVGIEDMVISCGFYKY